MKKENSGEIVMYQPDETIRLEVRMGDDTVWLTQQQMAELFQTDRTSIVRHINNIYKSEELDKESTCAFFATVQTEGKRKVERNLAFYNLDMIISVGYRVNSKRGTKFRQWANHVPKDINTHFLRVDGVKQPAISKHLINIFKSGELHEASVHSILEYTG